MDPQEKSDRLVEAASVVLNAAPNERLNAVVLNKALFYLDLASLRDRGTTVTQNAYIALQQGPVVARYDKRLIGQLESRGVAKQLEGWDGSKPIQLERRIESFQYIDAETIHLATVVTSYFADLSSREASYFSHDNPGWQMAWDAGRRSGRPQPVNLRVAMQQIVEDDLWIDLPLSDSDELFAASDAGDGIDW